MHREVPCHDVPRLICRSSPREHKRSCRNQDHFSRRYRRQAVERRKHKSHGLLRPGSDPTFRSGRHSVSAANGDQGQWRRVEREFGWAQKETRISSTGRYYKIVTQASRIRKWLQDHICPYAEGRETWFSNSSLPGLALAIGSVGSPAAGMVG